MIKQGTEEWLEAKQSTIGGSEIYALIYHYCQKDLEKLGFDLNKERPFRTIQEIFLKVKFGAKLSKIDQVFADFGIGMENYVAQRLQSEMPKLQVETSDEFVVNKLIHPLASCSPDGYVSTVGDSVILDFDGKKEISHLWGKGALEIKTANYFAGFTAEQGTKLQYLFQHQFQMIVLGLSWGLIAVLVPKQKEYDEPFFKGYILAKAEAEKYFEFDQYYDLVYYIHPALAAFQELILKALEAFQADLDAYDINPKVFPQNSEDLAGLQREKQLWAQLMPEHFGSKILEENSKIESLLLERAEAYKESLFATQAKDKIETEILQLIKSSKLDKFCEIKGKSQKIIWDKRGFLRYYANKK